MSLGSLLSSGRGAACRIGGTCWEEWKKGKFWSGSIVLEKPKLKKLIMTFKKKNKKSKMK